jgi:hypothetical protein
MKCSLAEFKAEYRVYKITGAVSICHYGFEKARGSKFPTWNETAGVQVLCACANPLPSSLSVCKVTQR